MPPRVRGKKHLSGTDTASPLSASRAPRQSAHERSSSIDSRVAGVGAAPATGTSSRSSIPLHERYSDARSSLHRPRHSTSSIDFTNRSSALGGNGVRRLSMTGSELRPSMTLEVNGVQRTLSSESLSTDSSGKHQPSRIGALFGWKGSSPHRPGSESPTTTYSDRSLSPAPSPRLGKHGLLSAPGSMARLTPPGLDIHKANSHESRFFHHPETPILIGTPEMNAHVQELERELAQVSSELAGSIRREIDLEDEIDRLKFEPPNLPASELGRRGSDYFSDSGASFTKFPISDPEAKIEEVERLRRKAEQEKAQLKLDTAQKLQTELGRRRDLEQLVQSLEDQLERRNLDDGVTRDFNEKLEELESTLEETRRRLAQEKEAKENFEDLYSALQVDLEQSRTERDSLRDEVIPQLKARLDVFETEPSKSSFGAQRAKDGSQSRFRSIAEESDDFSTTAGSGFGGSRAGSLARSSSKRGGSLSRSGSFKERSEGGGRQRSGSVGVTAEGVREVEDQRDALHQALKLLISRYEKQRKDHERTLKNLARENAAAQRKAAAVPQKGSQYQRELSALKDEVTTLRKRTEDALEQKWQYEKSLGGIKMDLDRAEHETRGLRSLLHEHDILAPSPRTLRGPSFENPLPTDESSRGSISTAETERDLARRLAEEFRQRAEALQKTRDPDPEGQSRRLAELLDAAKRMDDLAQQFDQQVSNNLVLRKRLADAIDKGEREQRQSTQQIEEMQKRLAGMEDSVLAAQQHSETTLTVHESEVRRIEEATSPRLQRLTVHIPEPSKLRAVITPGLKPRSRSTDSRKAKVSEASLLDASRTHMLERKVRELERLLGDAEDDMQLVVQRVNRSQLEVAELTTERDAALAQMRKLQDKFVDETERAEALMHDSRQAGRSPR